MITIEDLMAIEKDDLQEASKAVDISDLPQLVEPPHLLAPFTHSA